jgi:hypothetical protein
VLNRISQIGHEGTPHTRFTVYASETRLDFGWIDATGKPTVRGGAVQALDEKIGEFARDHATLRMPGQGSDLSTHLGHYPVARSSQAMGIAGIGSHAAIDSRTNVPMLISCGMTPMDDGWDPYHYEAYALHKHFYGRKNDKIERSAISG